MTAWEHWPDLDDLGYEFWREAHLEFEPPPLPRQLRPCGTQAAYQRHLRHREVPCDDCTRANTEASSGKRAAMRAALREAS